MKIGIVTTVVPYLYGGAEFLADSLRDKLIEYGHEAGVFTLPFSWMPLSNIVDGMMAARLTQLVNVDLMIGLKFPAYLAPHSNKKLWLLHQFRQAYDLSGTQYDVFSDSTHDQSIKKAIVSADNAYLRPLEGNIFTNSRVVSDRLMRHNGIASRVLFPPLMDSALFRRGQQGDYIFCPSRVNFSKRQHLLVEAMQYVKTSVKLVLAGVGDVKDDEHQIYRIIEKYRLEGKVTYYDRFITQQEKADLFADCLAGAYIPYDEDSYGYVALECLHSHKPLITCTDSGGTDIVVVNGETGYRVEPSPQALAEAMDKLYEERKHTLDMGESGFALIEKLGINWDTVIGRLTE